MMWRCDLHLIWKHWAYLAMVIDIYAHKTVGWAMSQPPNSELTSNALKIGYESDGRPKGMMFHSD